ncbi:MAG: acyl carrier protein [Planctomycetota bacterium]
MSQQEIFEKVTSTLVDALGVEEDEVTSKATLTGDLGAESIDFLDIVFRLEKNFGIKIPRGDLFPDEKLFTDPTFVQDGKMTDAGLKELRARMPYADVDAFAKNPDVQEISSLFTVDMIVKYIESKL